MIEAELELLHRVHYDKHFIEVGEWPDDASYVELRTTGVNVEYFGAINLSLTPQAAKLLAEALIATAASVEPKIER